MPARKSFDAELSDLSASLIRMGSIAARSIDAAIAAFDAHDLQAAAAVIEGDRQLDDMEREIERHCLTLLLRQQPVARDLRMISTALKMITDIERIGDASADIAEITRHISGEIPEILEQIDRMAAEARGMVFDAVDAFVKSDTSGPRRSSPGTTSWTRPSTRSSAGWWRCCGGTARWWTSRSTI